MTPSLSLIAVYLLEISWKYFPLLTLYPHYTSPYVLSFNIYSLVWRETGKHECVIWQKHEIHGMSYAPNVHR